MKDSHISPFETLGVPTSASPDDIRQAYLRLVREFPPDREPDRFRAIHAAYQELNDPLVQAKSIFDSYGAFDSPPDLAAIVSKAESRKARLSKLVLLSLGNDE